MAEATTVIACPECSKKFKGKASLEGKKIKCPFCKEAFVVPDAKAAIKAAEAQAKAQAPSAPMRMLEDGDDGKGYGVTTLDVAPRCPNCAELMEDEKAFICLFCGYNTLTRSWGKTEKVIEHTTADYTGHQMSAYIVIGVLVFIIAGSIFFNLWLPFILDPDGWASMFDAESMRMWSTLFWIACCWGGGLFCYRRLIVNPTPEEKKKE